MARKSVALPDRFWRYAKKTDGCWEWTGARLRAGYGQLGTWRGPQLAHRISWRMAYGPIPDGLFVLHRCDNPPCARPDHLFLGTIADNNADMVQKGRAVYRRKLTIDQVREARRRRGAGDTYAHIARDMGVKEPTIVSAVKRVSWAWLD